MINCAKDVPTKQLKINTEKLAYSIERKNGFICVDSEIAGVTYAIKKETIVIITGKNGILSFDLEMADNFLVELQQIVVLANERKRRKAGA